MRTTTNNPGPVTVLENFPVDSAEIAFKVEIAAKVRG
jgi:hypothetical protein